MGALACLAVSHWVRVVPGSVAGAVSLAPSSRSPCSLQLLSPGLRQYSASEGNVIVMIQCFLVVWEAALGLMVLFSLLSGQFRTAVCRGGPHRRAGGGQVRYTSLSSDHLLYVDMKDFPYY